MTQFRVLPVLRGDAYFLKSKRGSYLVDGGAPGGQLPEMLAERKAGKLRAVVCTSMSMERMGGVLDFMAEGNQATEYWIPASVETLAEAARRFNGDWDGWLQLAVPKCSSPMSGHSPWKGKPPSLSGEEPFRRLSGAAALIGLSVAACLGWAPYAGMRRESCPGRDRERLTRFFKWTLGLLADRAALRCTREDIGVHQLVSRTCLRLFSCAALEDVVLLCGKLILAEIERPDNPVSRSGTTDVVRLLTTAAMMSAMLAKIDSTVRFFTQADRLTDHLVSRHPIKCLNGAETSPLDVLPQRTVAEDVFRLAKDESAQGDGLIFQYGDVGCSVLFCGDSRFGFFKGRNSLILDRPTVVTAPSQGHCAANPAYRRISSNAPEADVWVRSHLPYARKVSEYYKDMPRKYCLANCVDLTVQEILLRFEYGRWRRSVNTVCACS